MYESIQSVAGSSAAWAQRICERLSLLEATKFMNYTARISGMQPGTVRTALTIFEFD